MKMKSTENMNPLNLLRQRHGLNFSDKKLQAIVNTCAEIIIIQDQQFAEDETRRIIDMMDGCSVCGDLNGYTCICDDDENNEEYE